ncbi:chemotaxis protein CheW [Gemmatimonadota bacterium]
MNGCLLVRAGGSEYGLRLDQVLEVVDGFEVSSAPAVHMAVRGVTQMRRRSVPLVNLSSLITNDSIPSTTMETAVLARCLGSLVAFEVDDADAVSHDEPVAVPDAWQLPWVCAVIRIDGSLVPVIDLDVLGERLVVSGDREQE